MKKALVLFWVLIVTSIVQAQHQGFFRLQDLGPCQFYINLSANDYPLFSPDYIYRKLRQKKVSWFDDMTSSFKGNNQLLSIA
jgi:hypothetical protein